MTLPSPSPAIAAFSRAARVIRRRLLLREAWRGGCVGTLALCGAATIRWWLGHGGTPWPLMVLPCAGVAVGVLRARRRRWSDADVAAYLDARWRQPETLLSWVHTPSDAALDASARALLDGERELPAPRAWSPVLLAASPLLAAVLVVLWLAPARVRAPLPTQDLRALPAPSLAALEGLRDLPARDEAERERRLALLEEAEKLDAALRRGISREEAQARLGALRDRLTDEHRNLGSANAGSGLDAAARALESRGMRALADTLASRDLAAFDDELERLAAEREKSDRASAKRALEEAAAAARRAGAEGIGSMLDQSRAALEERARRNEALHDFAEAMREAGVEEAAQAAEQLDRAGSAEAANAAADAMAKALAGLSDEEKKQLAKNLAKLKKGGALEGMQPPAAGEALDPKALAEQLKELAQADVEVGEAARDRGMQEAERNLDRAGGELRGAVPGPGSGGGQAGGSGKTPGRGGNPGHAAAGNDSTSGAGAGGPSRGGGPGTHEGATGPVEAGELRARARGRAGAGGAHVTVTGPGGEGQVPLRALGEVSAAARARELSNLDDGELPAEYRDQVRRYFTP